MKNQGGEIRKKNSKYLELEKSQIRKGNIPPEEKQVNTIAKEMATYLRGPGRENKRHSGRKSREHGCLGDHGIEGTVQTTTAFA